MKKILRHSENLGTHELGDFAVIHTRDREQWLGIGPTGTEVPRSLWSDFLCSKGTANKTPESMNQREAPRQASGFGAESSVRAGGDARDHSWPKPVCHAIREKQMECLSQ